jgi:hypothetical protein
MAYTFTARQGDTFHHRITITNDDGSPINLQNCSVEFSIAPVPAGTPANQYTQPPEVTITNPTQGELELVLTPTQTRALSLRWYVYELTITFSNARRLTILDGALTVEQEVKA